MQWNQPPQNLVSDPVLVADAIFKQPSYGRSQDRTVRGDSMSNFDPRCLGDRQVSPFLFLVLLFA